MAQRTIAPGGGNANVAATYVENAVPGTGDHIVGDATSGNLTVTANITVQRVDFTGYLGLLTINNNIQLTLGLAGGTSTFSEFGTYNFIGTGTAQGRIFRGTIALSLNMLGTIPIPRFLSQSFSSTAVLTALSDLYFINLNNGFVLIINGAFNTYVSGNLEANSSQFQFAGTQPYHMIGTGNFRGAMGLTVSFPATLIIDTAGTITVLTFIGVGRGGFANATDLSSTFTHIAGTIVNPVFLIQPALIGIAVGTVGTATLNLISGTTWNVYTNLTFGSSNFFENIIEFNGVANFDQFCVSSVDASTSINFQVRLQGDTNITCNDFIFYSHFNAIGGIPVQKSTIDLALTPGQSLTVNNSIDINGLTDKPNAFQTPPIELKSIVPGTAASLIVNTFNQRVSLARFTDIDCTGGNTLYGQELTLSNTTEIEQYTLPPSGGGGGGESSFVFFS